MYEPTSKERTCTKHGKKYNVGYFCPHCAPNIGCYTDKEYEAQRNSCIPDAILRANERIKKGRNAKGKFCGKQEFSKVFLEEMDRIVKERGI